MWSLTCSLALYPYRCIFPSRGVMRDSPHDHETHLQLPQLPPTPPSSLLIHLCRPDVVAAADTEPQPGALRSCSDLLMAVWVWKQRSASRTRALSVRDDEEGHLICRSGDVLQERCTHCHYSIVTLLHMSIIIEHLHDMGVSDDDDEALLECSSLWLKKQGGLQQCWWISALDTILVFVLGFSAVEPLVFHRFMIFLIVEFNL